MSPRAAAHANARHVDVARVGGDAPRPHVARERSTRGLRASRGRVEARPPRVVLDARTSSRRVVRAAADAGADRPRRPRAPPRGFLGAPLDVVHRRRAAALRARRARPRASPRSRRPTRRPPRRLARHPRDASLAVAAETAAPAGGVDVLIARALHLARDDQTLEVALHLATDAALVAARDAREAAAALEACVVAHADHPGRDREDAVEDAHVSTTRSTAPPSTIPSHSNPARRRRRSSSRLPSSAPP